MPATASETSRRASSRRDDLRIARVHLRLGQLTLARAELEDLLRRDALDIAGYAALAEARWRSGDGPLAADAAFAHLEGGGNDDVALCIAAEALAAEGRAQDARELMDRLPSADATALDALFAGMPRRAFWPAGPVDRSELDDLRRPADGRPAPSPGIGAAEVPPIALGRPAGPPPATSTVPGPREVLDAAATAGWEGGQHSIEDTQVHPAPARADRPVHSRRVKGQSEPAAELERARLELETKLERALLRLSLVLRHDPTLAPAVLDILRLRREPAAALVRGDAQRLLGRHLEAEAAFDSAAESLEVT